MFTRRWKDLLKATLDTAVSLWVFEGAADGRSVGSSIIHSTWIFQSGSDEAVWWRRGFYLARAGSNYCLSSLFSFPQRLSLFRWSSWWFEDVWSLELVAVLQQIRLWCVHQIMWPAGAALLPRSPEPPLINSFVFWIDNVTSVLYCRVTGFYSDVSVQFGIIWIISVWN